MTDSTPTATPDAGTLSETRDRELLEAGADIAARRVETKRVGRTGVVWHSSTATDE